MTSVQRSHEIASLLSCSSPTGMADLSWLWEDRVGEVVEPGPLSQKPLGTCRPLPAWDELASVMAMSCFDATAVTFDDSAATVYYTDPLSHNDVYYVSSPPPAPLPKVPPTAKHCLLDCPQLAKPRRQPFQHRNGGRQEQGAGLKRWGSLLTMAEAQLSPPGSAAMWRGLGLPESLEERHCQGLEIARHRHDMDARRKAQDRLQARIYREDKERLHFSVSRRASAERHRSSARGSQIDRIFIAPSTKKEGVSQEIQQKIDDAGIFFSKGLRKKGPGAKNLDMLEQTMMMSEASPANSQCPRVSIDPAAAENLKEDEEQMDKRSQKKRATLKRLLGPTKENPGTPKSGGGGYSSERSDVSRADTETGSPTSPNRSRRGQTDNVDIPKPTGKKSLIMKSRMRRLLERRKQEFSAWPPAEQTRLRQAFKAGDHSGLAMLDAKGLRSALAELGLEGRTHHEKDSIGAISREAAIRGNINFFDFVFQLVPEVEHKLEEMRSPTLYAEFEKLDNGTGRIKEAQCLCGLEQHARSQVSVDEETIAAFWKFFIKDFSEMYKARSQGTEGFVDFKGFQHLVTQLDARRADYFQKLEKRIACLEGLPPQLEALHIGELSVLKRVFDNSDLSGNGCIFVVGATYSLLQSGVAAPVGPMWEKLQHAMDECDGFVVSFKDFLLLVDSMRDEARTILKIDIQDLFKSYNISFTNAPSIILCEVPALMVELPFCSGCFTNQDDLMGLVNACEKDVGSELDVDALVALILKVVEKCRFMQRESEAVVARQLGFTMKQVVQLRESFAALSTTGTIGVPEVMKWFKEINPNVEVIEADIEALIEEVSPLPFQSGFTCELNSAETDFFSDDADASRSPLEESFGDECLDHGPDNQGCPESMRSTHHQESVKSRKPDNDLGLAVKDMGDESQGRRVSFRDDVPAATEKAKPTIAILGLEDGDFTPVTHTTSISDFHLPPSQAAGTITLQRGSLEQEAPKLIEMQLPEEEDTAPVYASSNPSNPPAAETHVLYFEGYMRLMHMILKA